jgi:pSer/pThr/pTyr-binding forkhead associated (FHA) protein
MVDPVSVALKFGFLAVLYLFLLWISRNALKDLKRTSATTAAPGGAYAPVASAPVDATGIHSASTQGQVAEGDMDPRLVVERAPGHVPGMEYEVGEGAIMGRGDQAEIRLEDPFASSRHARLIRQGAVIVIEDMGSTNGTYLNEELLSGPQPLHAGDRVRIGDSEFTYMDR